MKPITASAPGKLVLAGEYAVLDGHEALSVSVSRRVHVKVDANHGKESIIKTRNKLIQAVAQEFLERGIELPNTKCDIDSSDLHLDVNGRVIKLGIGSSSAMAVAMTAGLLRACDQDLTNCFEMAREAHRRFNHHRGSGVDVATCYHGGAIRYSISSNVPSVTKCVLSFDMRLVLPVYTGIAQSTGSFLARVSEFAEEHCYGHAIDGIGHAARRMTEVMTQRGSFEDLRSAVEEHNYWMSQLGKVASAEVLSKQHNELEALCKNYGGFAKPSGAGGGDISLCFVPLAAQDFFKKDLENTNYRAINLDFCVSGLESA